MRFENISVRIYKDFMKNWNIEGERVILKIRH